MRRGLIKVGKWLGFLGGILLALNVEAVFAALGLNNVAANPAFLRTAGLVIQSPTTIAAALIFLGFGLFATLDWFARKWDASHPSPDQRLCDMWPDMYDLSETIRRDMENGAAMASMGLASRITTKYTSLRQLGVACPPMGSPWEMGRYWLATQKMFLDLIVPSLREGHPGEARANAEETVNNFADQPVEWRWHVERQVAQAQGVDLPEAWPGPPKPPQRNQVGGESSVPRKGEDE